MRPACPPLLPDKVSKHSRDPHLAPSENDPPWDRVPIPQYSILYGPDRPLADTSSMASTDVTHPKLSPKAVSSLNTQRRQLLDFYGLVLEISEPAERT